jgi:hypothetical protein
MQLYSSLVVCVHTVICDMVAFLSQQQLRFSSHLDLNNSGISSSSSSSSSAHDASTRVDVDDDLGDPELGSPHLSANSFDDGPLPSPLPSPPSDHPTVNAQSIHRQSFPLEEDLRHDSNPTPSRRRRLSSLPRLPSSRPDSVDDIAQEFDDSANGPNVRPALQSQLLYMYACMYACVCVCVCLWCNFFCLSNQSNVFLFLDWYWMQMQRFDVDEDGARHGSAMLPAPILPSNASPTRLYSSNVQPFVTLPRPKPNRFDSLSLSLTHTHTHTQSSRVRFTNACCRSAHPAQCLGRSSRGNCCCNRNYSVHNAGICSHTQPFRS